MLRFIFQTVQKPYKNLEKRLEMLLGALKQVRITDTNDTISICVVKWFSLFHIQVSNRSIASKIQTYNMKV